MTVGCTSCHQSLLSALAAYASRAGASVEADAPAQPVEAGSVDAADAIAGVVDIVEIGAISPSDDGTAGQPQDEPSADELTPLPADPTVGTPSDDDALPPRLRPAHGVLRKLETDGFRGRAAERLAQNFAPELAARAANRPSNLTGSTVDALA
jgi:hypothetical protein